MAIPDQAGRDVIYTTAQVLRDADCPGDRLQQGKASCFPLHGSPELGDKWLHWVTWPERIYSSSWNYRARENSVWLSAPAVAVHVLSLGWIWGWSFCLLWGLDEVPCSRAPLFPGLWCRGALLPAHSPPEEHAVTLAAWGLGRQRRWHGELWEVPGGGVNICCGGKLDESRREMG